MQLKDSVSKNLNAWPFWLQQYAEGKLNPAGFSAFEPGLKGIQEAAKERNKFPVNRKLLVDVLRKQNQSYFERFPLIKHHIDRLSDEAVFTLTTGHQLVPGYGPSFWYYKIATVIRLSKLLKEHEINTIPVLWLASEDHDIDEIRSFQSSDKIITWNRTYSGASGRIDFDQWKDFYKELLDSRKNTAINSALLEGLKSFESFNGSLSDWTRHLALHAFGEDGLVVIDADEKELKKQVLDIAKEELVHQASFKVLEKNLKTWQKFRGESIPYPAFPRPYNFFLLNKEGRYRVEKGEGGWIAGPLHFNSPDELLDLLTSNPEQFSPNVILRPVYQERILPNLAYIGGPGEMAYWLQLKPVFDTYRVFFPALLPRDSYLVLPPYFMDKWKKFGLADDDWTLPEQIILDKYLASHSPDFSFLIPRKVQLKKLYDELAIDFGNLDATLSATVKAEYTKSVSGLESLEKKLLRNLKKLHEDKLASLKRLLATIKPGDSVQERTLTTLDLEQLFAGRLNGLKEGKQEPAMNTRLIEL